MKEYLAKVNGVYRIVKDNEMVSGRIEIPDGADFYAEDKMYGKMCTYFYKDNYIDPPHGAVFIDNMWHRCQFNKDKQTVLWERKSTSTLVEYLNPSNWSLHMVDVDNDAAGEDWLLVPEGADEFYIENDGDGSTSFFMKNENGEVLFCYKWLNSTWNNWKNFGDDSLTLHRCVWRRHNQPEELPFIDDEPTTAWNKQEGGSHYKDLKIQPMQYALENKLDYAQANVVKYVTRHANKNGKEDLLKAIHNIELMIDYYYGGEK